MRTKIEIENGNTVIVLLPENKFEESLIQDWYDEDKDSDVKVYKKNTSGWHNALPNNQITITLKEKTVKDRIEVPMREFTPNPIYTTDTQPPTWIQLKISELNRGDLVRHKSGGKAYVVDGAYGDRASAHASVDITNESEWEVLQSAR